MKNPFANWNYKKHAKVIGIIYAASFAIDMTLGYLVIKRYVDPETKKEA